MDQHNEKQDPVHKYLNSMSITEYYLLLRVFQHRIIHNIENCKF